MSRAAPTPSPPAARSIPTTRITYVAGSLTVTAAPLTITADNQTKVYGAALPTLTASYSGFVNGDTSASLTTQPTLTTTATASSHVVGQSLHHHRQPARSIPTTRSRYVAGTPDRHPGAADDHRRQPDQGLRRGAADPDGQLLRLRQRRHSGQPDHPAHAEHHRHRQPASRGSPYAITASGAVDRTTAISYVAGTLTVTPAALTITADNQTKVYGAALPTLTGQLLRLRQRRHLGQPEHPAHAEHDGHRQPAMSAAYAITASGAVDSDYTISYVGGTLTVTPATLTVVADSLTRPEGDANPPLTYSLSGLVNGDTTSVVSGAPILSTTATIASFDGQYPITVAVGTLAPLTTTSPPSTAT